MKDGGLMRYRCHVGHAYSADTLLAEKATSLEATLWACVQMLDENADLSRRLARRARDGARSALAARLEQRARVAEDHRERLRQVLASGLGPALEAAGPEESAAARQEEEVH
jgi:two-component system chemotaxis response regulator CheB